MGLVLQSPAKSLSPSLRRQGLPRDLVDRFKANLVRLLDKVDEGESEEHLKNLVSEFLKDTWYKPEYEINTRDRADLAIHSGKSSSDPVVVLFEIKRPTNRAEMVTPEKPNAKALHELLHYYMRERFVDGNTGIQRLVVCNGYDWYLFDAADVERAFLADKKPVDDYRRWAEGRLGSSNTEWCYRNIVGPFVERHLAALPCVRIDLRDFEAAARDVSGKGDRTLLVPCKLLSPAHLLKLPVGNDSNSLDRNFYVELLHIVGLEEVRDGGRKFIRRRPEGDRMDGSLLENAVERLRSKKALSSLPSPERYGDVEEERLFSVGLELCLAWVNRVLFLKLLEGQLVAWNKAGKGAAFLSSARIGGFDELNELFFDVLAVPFEKRSPAAREKFGDVPYLNSSLFEETDLERGASLRIADLTSRLEIPLHPSTVLRDSAGKRLSGNRNTLRYLLDFLDAYDFSAEGAEGIRERGRTIINASVLGLIFEKINGYKDGSFFTPGFVTMSICRETIRRAVVRKFNDRFGWRCESVGDLYNRIDRNALKEANAVVDSVTVCDPAVGSGHFLVSCLNEIVAIKSELHILLDREGRRLRDVAVSVENDELVVTSDDHFFEYNPKNPDSQRVQEALFHEKESIIENSLFGVDINPKSVMICRLRLWIELLKHAYYRKEERKGEPRRLETLPNIDINIKCGDSLVGRFALVGNPDIAPGERKKLKELTAIYRRHVADYKMSPSNKAELRQVIDRLKVDLSNFALPKDREIKDLRLIEGKLSQMPLFPPTPEEVDERRRWEMAADAIRRRIDESRRTVYADAFEWRFEFPEVLSADGDFVGFDAVIGNPPYIRHEAIKSRKPVLKEVFGAFYCGTADLYTYFFKAGLDLVRPGGLLCYIAPNKFMRAGYGRKTRELLTTKALPLRVVDFGDLPVFEEATTYPAIVLVEKASAFVPAPSKSMRKRKKEDAPPPSTDARCFTATFTDPKQWDRFDETLSAIGFDLPVSALSPDGWVLERPEARALMAKMRSTGTPLGEWVGGRLYYGIKTGFNEAFVVDEATRAALIAEDPRSAELIRPWLRGRDIRKWAAAWAGVHLVAIENGGNRAWPWSGETSEEKARAIFAKEYPAVHRHLSQWEGKLRERDDQGRFWWELRACAYMAEFARPKIVWRHFAETPEFIYDEAGFLSNDKSYILPTDDLSLLGILNSSATAFFLGKLSPPVQGGFMELRKIYLEQLPIPPATDAQKAEIAERVRAILADPSSPSVPRLEAEIDRLVARLFDLSPDEVALVERPA